jgi:hypothetical protein
VHFLVLVPIFLNKLPFFSVGRFKAGRVHTDAFPIARGWSGKTHCTGGRPETAAEVSCSNCPSCREYSLLPTAWMRPGFMASLQMPPQALAGVSRISCCASEEEQKPIHTIRLALGATTRKGASQSAAFFFEGVLCLVVWSYWFAPRAHRRHCPSVQ